MSQSKVERAEKSARIKKYYDATCVRRPRLAGFLKHVRVKHPTYECRPVSQFGRWNSPLLIVGLAPGLHGANATGRPFTGDHAGIMLYRTLYEFGFSSSPESFKGDDLELYGCMITNAVKCLPPANKPNAAEVNACRSFLIQELATVPVNGVVLVLGRLAHDSVVRALGFTLSQMPFRHAGELKLTDQRTLVSSYHCSRYNTQTRRLTQAMFNDVFSRVRELLS